MPARLDDAVAAVQAARDRAALVHGNQDVRGVLRESDVVCHGCVSLLFVVEPGQPTPAGHRLSVVGRGSRIGQAGGAGLLTAGGIV